MQSKLIVFGQPINIISKNKKVINYFESLSRLHTFEVSKPLKPFDLNTIDFTISTNSNNISFSFNKNDKTFHLITNDWEDIVNSGTIENIIGQIVNYSCLLNQIFPLHSSCIEFQKKAYLFIGNSGAGKTSWFF